MDVLIAAIGTIVGQLLSALILDILLSAPGSIVTVATISGTVLTLSTVFVASYPESEEKLVSRALRTERTKGNRPTRVSLI